MVAYAKKRLQLVGDLSKSDFDKLYKSCKNARLKERYHAMLLSYDYEWKEVAKILSRSYEQVLEWVKAYNKGGIDSLVSKKQKGNQPKLTPVQKAELKTLVTNEPRALEYDFSNWNTKILKGVIKDKFGIEMSQESVRRNLRKLGFVWKKPEHRFVLSDKQEQAKFTRLLRKAVKEKKNGEVILFEDECTLKQHPTLKNTWILKGMRKFIGTFGNHAKRNVFGFVDVLNGGIFTKVTDSLKSDEFIACLEGVKRKYRGRFVRLFADNGPCHTSKKTEKYIKDNSDWLAVTYIPKQSPELNPVEQLWQQLRNAVTHNHLFRTIGELGEALARFLSNLTRRQVLSICGIESVIGVF